MSSSKQEIKKTVKKHIPKDWLTELRIVYRITLEAFLDIKRTGIVNLVIITTMAAILTIFGALFRTALSISSFAQELGSELEISVYLKSSASPQIVKNKISGISHVERVKVISKQKSWNDLKREIEIP